VRRQGRKLQKGSTDAEERSEFTSQKKAEGCRCRRMRNEEKGKKEEKKGICRNGARKRRKMSKKGE